jgi:hypothetical protein
LLEQAGYRVSWQGSSSQTAACSASHFFIQLLLMSPDKANLLIVSCVCFQHNSPEICSSVSSSLAPLAAALYFLSLEYISLCCHFLVQVCWLEALSLYVIRWTLAGV